MPSTADAFDDLTTLAAAVPRDMSNIDSRPIEATIDVPRHHLDGAVTGRFGAPAH
jgi:hypothetical protein